MAHQQSPEIQNKRSAWRKLVKISRPLKTGKMTNNDSSVKKLRQKVTSKLLAASRWRVTTPAVDHKKATSTMTTTARLWVSFTSAKGVPPPAVS
jgi:hypothetical protein